MTESHPGYEWEKGKAPRRVDVEDREDTIPKMPEIPVATGARKRWIAATDSAHEAKRKLWKRKI